jgi:hypothetical protein
MANYWPAKIPADWDPTDHGELVAELRRVTDDLIDFPRATRTMVTRVISASTDAVILADAADGFLNFTGSNAKTITLPSNTTAAIPLSTPIPYAVEGSGLVTWVAGSGASVITEGGVDFTSPTGRLGCVIKVGLNKWLLS